MNGVLPPERWVAGECANDMCRQEFLRKRAQQRYCSPRCRRAAIQRRWKRKVGYGRSPVVAAYHRKYRALHRGERQAQQKASARRIRGGNADSRPGSICWANKTVCGSENGSRGSHRHCVCGDPIARDRRSCGDPRCVAELALYNV